MVNTACPVCGGYFDPMVQEMCDTCLAEKVIRLTAELAEARELLREHLEIIEEDLNKGRYMVPGLLRARADRIRAAIDAGKVE